MLVERGYYFRGFAAAGKARLAAMIE